MKCPNEKELVLYYYKELNQQTIQEIGEHLKQCPRCLASYNKTADLFAGDRTPAFTLSRAEQNVILENVKQDINASVDEKRIGRRISQWLEDVKGVFVYRPQLAGVLVVCLLILVLLPFIGRFRTSSQQEFDIFKLQFELTIDDPQGSLFDLYYTDDVGVINGVFQQDNDPHLAAA